MLFPFSNGIIYLLVIYHWLSPTVRGELEPTQVSVQAAAVVSDVSCVSWNEEQVRKWLTDNQLGSYDAR